MRSTTSLVPLQRAFDVIGLLEFDQEWTGLESQAIRLGQRSRYQPEVWARGHRARKLMLEAIECERLGIVFYSDDCRIRYGTAASPKITNVYPFQTDDPDIGYVQLAHEDIYYAVADIGRLPSPKCPSSATPGPKPSFGPFRDAGEKYMLEFGPSATNAEVIAALQAAGMSLDQMPKKTRAREILNELRAKILGGEVTITNSDQTATGAL